MPSYVSPGVYVIEKDVSQYIPSTNPSVVGIVGFASKGPTNKATLITSQENLIKTFGQPSENIPGQGLEGALEILETTNSVYFVRAANESGASVGLDASASVQLGACPAVIVSGPLTRDTKDQGFGLTTGLYLEVDVYNNNGAKVNSSPLAYSIPAGTIDSSLTNACQALALKTVIGGQILSDEVGAFDNNQTLISNGSLELSGALVGRYAGSGASIGVSAWTNSVKGTTVACLRAMDHTAADTAFGASGTFASSIRVFGSSFVTTGTNGLFYNIESLYAGAGYNGGSTPVGETSGNSVTVTPYGNGTFNIEVNDQGSVAESFIGGLFFSGPFIETQINTGETNNTSEYIKGNTFWNGSDLPSTGALNNFASLISTINSTLVTGVQGTQAGPVKTNITDFKNARFVKPIAGTTNLAGGTNGYDTASTSNQATTLIGSNATVPKTGIYALNDDTLNVGIALVPGVYTQTVQDALITLAESSQNFLALVSPPYGIGTVQNAIDWTNGRSASTAGSRARAINSSYAAVFFPHVKVYSVFDGKDRWYDPTIFAARQMAFTDAVSESWFAPAGYVRGRLTKPSDVELNLNQGDRDSLYGGGNVVNPIVNFAQQGITIFGQRTSQRTPSSLDRINVRRLMIYLRKVILQGTRSFVFEPNDEFTWAKVEATTIALLDDIKARRGVTDFRVICDATTNTPARVDRNELWCKVILQPTKAAEVVVFELNLTSQSADLGTL